MKDKLHMDKIIINYTPVFLCTKHWMEISITFGKNRNADGISEYNCDYQLSYKLSGIYLVTTATFPAAALLAYNWSLLHGCMTAFGWSIGHHITGASPAVQSNVLAAVTGE